MKGKVVNIKLNPAVKWTNGQPVTSADYVWSWLRTISPELGADYAYQFYGIQGAEAYNGCDPGKANCNALKNKVGIKAVGKYGLPDHADLAAAVVHPADVAPLVPADQQGGRDEVRQQVDGAPEHRHRRSVQALRVEA